MKTVLILPGDVRRNLGDTAICLGLVQMVRMAEPDASILIWSHAPDVVDAFGDVTFARSSGMGLAGALRRADLVIWGGGQLLQSNRSRVKVPMWLARITLARLLGARIVGIGQGVGPLPSAISRWLAARTIRLCRSFSVRDQRSVELNERIGLGPNLRVLSADPAIVHASETAPAPNPDRSGAIGVALRYTGHHSQRRTVPFQMLPAAQQDAAFETDAYRAFEAGATRLVADLRERTGAPVRLITMYTAPWETDHRLARSIVASLDDPEVTQLTLAEGDVSGLLAAMDSFAMMISTPMHGTILSTARGVPTLALPYEDKGFDFMDGIGQGARTLSSRLLMTDDGRAEVTEAACGLWDTQDAVRSALAAAIPNARDRALGAVETIRSELETAP